MIFYRKQTFKNATLLYCGNNSQIVKALDLANDEKIESNPKSVLRAFPTLSKPQQFQSALDPNIFSAQEAETISNAEATTFWNRILMTKHFDTTLKLWGKTITFDLLTFFEKHSTDVYSTPHRSWFNSDNA